VTDPAIVGTFNYYTYDLNNPNDPDKTKHGVDIATWVLWESGINDKTSMDKRVEVLAMGTYISKNYYSISEWSKNNGYGNVGMKELIEYGGNGFQNFYNNQKNNIIQNVKEIKKQFGW
jgi:hypothetical protein